MSDEVRSNTQTPVAGDKATRVQIVPAAGTSASNVIALEAGTVVDTELPAAAALGDSAANPTVPTVGADLSGWDELNSLWRRLRTAASDGFNPALALVATPGVFDGSLIQRQRTPNTFKSFATTAITAGTGATIWTPAGGKKFRVMGLAISSSAAGQLLLGDNAVATVIARSETLAAGATWRSYGDWGNGILSGAADRVLKLDGPTGNVMGMVWGTEES